jgi:uncharacterized cupin superfamily protein
MIEEARLEQTEAGLAPASEGWFVMNVRDAQWRLRPPFGSGCRFEGVDETFAFSEFGINIRVLEPGEPNCRYHRESNQEAFLVLQGEPLLLVEEQERRLKPWDFVHMPPDATHVFVGAGDGTSVILMVGTRDPHEQLVYPASELAQRHNAGVQEETDDPQVAYSDLEPPTAGRPRSWNKLPWA